MNTRQLIGKSGIELQSSGFAVYSEFVTLEEFQKLCDCVREDEMNIVLSNILELFRAKAESSLNNFEEHRVWKIAINLIEDQFCNE